MNFWFLIICFGLAFVMQFLFSMLQIKNFTKHFTVLRKMGKVAIGKRKGGFRAGSIVMFAVDNDGNILKGMYMSGVTVLAKFKEIKGFDGKNVSTLTEIDGKKYSKQVKKAILNAKENYNIIMNGGEVPESLSPFAQLGTSIKKVTTKK